MSNPVITVSRQFGSGGRTIAKEVARRLNLPYYSRELVDRISEESGFSREMVEEIGEYASVSSNFLFNIAVSSHPMGMTDSMSASDRLFVCQTNIVRELAEKEPCVIVGRCADYVLRDNPDAFHVFIHADTEHRAERVLARYGETKQPIEKRLQEKDNRRRVYYKHYTNRNWGEASNYTLCLDSGKIGVENCIELLCDLLKDRF